MERKIFVFLRFWRTWLTLLAPVALCPLVFHIGTSEANCAFVILVMAVYWVTECIPLPVTALLPVVLLPVLRIMSTEEVCITYLKESNMMFIGNTRRLSSLQMTYDTSLIRFPDNSNSCGEV